MKKSAIIEWVSVVLALAALVVSYNLLQKHLTGSFAMGMFDMGCSASQEKGAADCAAVLASPWSYWPPRVGENNDKGGVPVALLGLVYYSVLSIWLIGVGKPSRSRRWLHSLLLLFIGFGLAGSAYFIWVMFTKLDQWCPWCLVTHGLNLLLAMCMVMLWPRQSRPTTPVEGDAAPQPARNYPTKRQVAVTLLAICLAVYGEKQLLASSNWQKRAEFYEDYVKDMMDDGGRMFKNWEQTPPTIIRITNEHPIRKHGGDPKMAVPVIMFSDFECPTCKKMATFMEEQVQPLFANNLNIIYKHYPLDQACNSRIKKPFHLHACEGALIAEAARRVNGNDGFWKVHDILYKNQQSLHKGILPVEVVAEIAGLDKAAMRSAYDSKVAQDFVAADIADAGAVGVTGTPTIFITGRRVDRVAVTAIKFWDAMAERYWKQLATSRPESTKLKEKEKK